MSVIQAGNTTTTSLIYTGDTTGNLVFTTGGANTVALTLANTQAATFANNVTISGNSTVTGTLTATGGIIQGANAAPAFSVYPSASVSITSSVTTLLTWNTKVFDTANAFNNTGSVATLNGISVPAYSFCPPVAGYYQISGNIAFTTSTGIAQVGIFKNGGQYCVAIGKADVQGIGPCVSTVVYLNGTSDYISVYGYQTSGSTYTTFAGRPDLNWIAGSLIRSA